MSNEHIIEVRSEEERRQHVRRREDQVRTLEQAAEMLSRERRYALLQAAATIHALASVDDETEGWTVNDAVNEAMDLLEIIEKRERERQGKDETK